MPWDRRVIGARLPRIVVAIDRANARFPWSHNDHFHGWLLRRLPAARGTAVDVGCGRGELVAALRGRGRFARVVGVDPDERMAREAAGRFAADPGVHVAQVAFGDLAPGDGVVPDGGADALTMVASLHHLSHETSLTEALRRSRGLLAPGGRLLVVGLSRPSTPRDFAVDAVSVALNPLVGMVKRAFGRGAHAGEDGMPVRDPDETFTAVVGAAAAELPGARVRRRLFFRYSLEWTAPAAVLSSAEPPAGSSR